MPQAASLSTKNRTRRITNHQHPLSNQMIEQINIALEQKGSRDFSAWVIEPAVGD